MSASQPPREDDGARRRWFSHQPNVPGVGIVRSYSPRFWGVVVAIGVVSGIGASLMVALLRLVERLAYGHRAPTLLAAARAAPGWRHLAALLLAALIIVVGLRVLGRLPVSGGTEVSEALWLRSGRLDFVASIARGVLSIVTVGMGVSLGREAAPQLIGAATASRLAEWAQFPVWQRRLLVACGAGAGFAAVYNVPLGGALLALEVLLGTLALSLVLPALLASLIATAVAWIYLGTGPLYKIATYAFHPSQLVFAAVLGPVLGLAAVGWVRLVGLASRLRPKANGRYLAPFGVFGALALISIPYPQLLGNGRDIVQLAIVGRISLGLLVILFLLKPLVTAACLASGSPGGLFTPSFAIGSLLAGIGGWVFAHLWSGAAAGSYALIGGGAFLAAAMQGPLSATVLVLELTRHFDALMVPTLLAVVEATVVARVLGAKSIYSARLGYGSEPEPDEEVSPPAGAEAIAAVRALDETLPPDVTGVPRPEPVRPPPREH